MHDAVHIAPAVLAVEPHWRERIGQRMRRCLARENFRDADLKAIDAGCAIRQRSADFGRELGRHHLVGVDVEEPEMPAILLGEALLRSVAGPLIVDDPRALPLGDGNRCIRGA